MRHLYHNTRRRINRTNRTLEALAVHLALLAVLAIVGYVVWIWLTGPAQAGRQLRPVPKEVKWKI